jgi:hypothetical protein
MALFELDTTGGAGAAGATPRDCDTYRLLSAARAGPPRPPGSRPHLADPWPAYSGAETLADARLAAAAAGARLSCARSGASFDAVAFVRTLEFNSGGE